MPTAPKVLDLGEPRDAQFAMASLSRPALLVANPLCSKSVSIAQSSQGK